MLAIFSSKFNLQPTNIFVNKVTARKLIFENLPTFVALLGSAQNVLPLITFSRHWGDYVVMLQSFSIVFYLESVLTTALIDCN